GAQLGLVGSLIARMYYLQVVEAQRYKVLAEENRINLRLLAPRRGRILDRFGAPLAGNDQNYRFVPVVVRENLSWDEVSRIEVNIDELPGVNIEVGLSRFYPFGERASQIVG